MPEMVDTSPAPMDEEASRERNKKSSRSGSPSAKPIDNVALAAMLRESANFVENGEFDPILYQTLIDFRAYYKKHLPKKKEKEKERSDDRSRKKRSKKKIISQTTKYIPADKVKKQEATTTSADDETNTTNNTSKTVATEPASPVPETAENNAGDVADLKKSAIDSEAESEPKEIPTPAPAPPVSSPGRKNNAAPVDTAHAAGSPSPATIQKAHLPTAMFGSFKFPKLHVPIPNTASFATTSKKNAQRAKADLEEFVATDLAKQAEASTRRKVAGDEPPSLSTTAPSTAPPTPFDSIGDWCEIHQTANCRCRMPDMGTDGIAYATASTGNDDSSFITRESSTTSFPSTRSENNNATAIPSQAHGEASGAAGVVNEETPRAEAFPGTMQPQQTKPAFQRPVNKESSLVANGWIEQQRRSKMRFVWKEVLASLVQGRKPGEETTLWIQREITNPVSGKRELEALHQIPMKLLQEVAYLDHSLDNRFTVKLFNQTDEFIFRCSDDMAAINWVMTLKKFEEEAKGKTTQKESFPGVQKSPSTVNDSYPFDEEKKGPDSAPPASAPSERLTIRELRAMCHGAGINTTGMERAELEAAAERVRQQGTYFAPPPGVNFPNVPMGRPASQPQTKEAPAPQPASAPPRAQPKQPPQPQQAQPPEREPAVPEPAPAPAPTATATATPVSDAPKKLSVKELRAICHGAGINTAGMERRELQAAADKVLQRGTYFDPPPGAYHMPTATSPPTGNDDQRAKQEELQRQEALRAAKEEMQRQEELRARQEELRKQEEKRAREAELRRKEELRRQEEMRRQEQIRAHQEELRRQEELRKKQEQEMLERQRREAEEARRRQMEEERRKAEQQAAEQQRRYAEQQAAWHRQQQEEMQRRHAAEQHAAEQRRRHEEAMRNQQRWAGQPAHQQQWNQQSHPGQQNPQSQHHWQQQQQHQNNPFNQHHPHQQQGWHQQQAHHQPPPQHQYHPHQQQQQQPQHHHHPGQQNANTQRHSAADDKYAKMANQSDDDGQATITRIKHDILIHWALQPPQLQMLKPVDILVSTIHNVFPPALGVGAHDYFTKWKAIDRNGVLAANGLPDDEKLKKAVRKVRFFLHPDKLPKDLNPEQQFMTKMLWDVTSDAWEEFEKSKEALDWIR